MRKKLFHVACFLCAGLLVPITVFGSELTDEKLWEIAKEACSENLWVAAFSGPNKPVGQRSFKCQERDEKAWRNLADQILDYSKTANTSKTFNDKLSNFKNLFTECKESVLPEWNMKEWDFGTEAIVHAMSEWALSTGTFVNSDLAQLIPFVMKQLRPFTLKQDLDFLGRIDTFAKELRAWYNYLRTIQTAMAESKISPETLEKLSKTLAERHSAVLPLMPARTPLEMYYESDFLEAANDCAFMKKFNTLRRTASFENFKPRNFKAEEAKAKDNFDILGLDMKRVKYQNPFESENRKEQVGAFLQQTVEDFTKEIQSAYGHIGKVADANCIGAMNVLYTLTGDAWDSEKPFEPESVMRLFKEAMLRCDIDMLIDKNKPKPEVNALHQGFKQLKNNKGIDTSAVEKSIYDTYIARFENDVKKHFYALIAALWDFENHQISFIKTVRQIEMAKYGDPEAARQNATKQVTEWRLKREKYKQQWRVAESNFYNVFFGGKRKDWWGNDLTTIGAIKPPVCIKILEGRLKDYGLWEPIIQEKKEDLKKEEDPNKPNDKKQNIIVEDKEERIEPIVASSYTKLTNEKEN